MTSNIMCNTGYGTSDNMRSGRNVVNKAQDYQYMGLRFDPRFLRSFGSDFNQGSVSV